MENASKALIIAGAILISIVLIGVGVLIVGNAQGIFDQGSQQMSQMEITSYNSPFTTFEGRQTGSNVRTLIQNIFSHNTTHSGDDSKQVYFSENEGADGDLITGSNVSGIKGKIKVGSIYNVSFKYDEETGLIKTVYAVLNGGKKGE